MNPVEAIIGNNLANLRMEVQVFFKQKLYTIHDLIHDYVKSTRDLKYFHLDISHEYNTSGLEHFIEISYEDEYDSDVIQFSDYECEALLLHPLQEALDDLQGLFDWMRGSNIYVTAKLGGDVFESTCCVGDFCWE